MEGARSHAIELLCMAFEKVRDREQCYQLIQYLLSDREVHEIANRVRIFIGLLDGNTYAEVAKNTGASMATIARMSRKLWEANPKFHEILELWRETGSMSAKTWKHLYEEETLDTQDPTFPKNK